MPETPPPTNNFPEEFKDKLRQIRANNTRAGNILQDLEAYYQAFATLRDKLDDDSDGLAVNLEWSQKRREEIDRLASEATARLSELENVAKTTKAIADQIRGQYDIFTPLAAKLQDPTTGIEAILTFATRMKSDIADLKTGAEESLTSVRSILTDISTKHKEVEAAYAAFQGLKEKIDDPEMGVEAQIAAIKKFAKDAAKAKNSAEEELASVISLKSSVEEHESSIKASLDEVDGLKDESLKLTDDIRNNLGLSSAHSLSNAITDQRKRLDRAVNAWGAGVGLVTLLLSSFLGYLFYMLFVDKQSPANVIHMSNGLGLLLTVVSKALFSSPLVFALYFVTRNFGRTRELRDKYVSKEIAAKNLQAYVKLLRDEFTESKGRRLSFTLHNMQAIYDDPTIDGKKRRYNIGINKIFQFGIEEEDARQLKEKLVEGAEEILENKKQPSA